MDPNFWIFVPILIIIVHIRTAVFLILLLRKTVIIISLLIKFHCLKPLQVETSYTTHKRNFESIDNALSDIYNSSVFPSLHVSDVDESVHLYNSTLSSIFDKHCPYESKTVKSCYGKAWYTCELRDLKRKLRSAERQYKNRRTSYAKNELKTIRNLYKAGCKRRKQNFFGNNMQKTERM